MESISTFLAADHKSCDKTFAEMERAVSKKEWSSAEKLFGDFRSSLEHHFGMEERVMFPAFEERTGHTGGPTAMMRMEHEQMRHLVQKMAAGVEKKDVNSVLGESETLMILMQQHNAKEEQMLYRMADQVLGGVSAEIVERMKAI